MTTSEPTPEPKPSPTVEPVSAAEPSSPSTSPAPSAASPTRHDPLPSTTDAIVLDAVPLEPPFKDLATVSRNLRVIGHSVIDPLCKRHGLNELGLFTLVHLAKEPDQLPSHLSGILHAKRTNIASTLRTLEYKGLVTIGASEYDRRQRLVNLTDKGCETVAAVEEGMEEARAALVERIDADRMERIAEAWDDFRSIVADMANSLEEPSPAC